MADAAISTTPVTSGNRKYGSMSRDRKCKPIGIYGSASTFLLISSAGMIYTYRRFAPAIPDPSR